VNFLADAQARADFVALLARLGHDTITVQSLGLHLEPDEHLVAEARARGRIFLSFDNFRGETGRRVAIEIHEHGGKVIQFAGGPQQPPERSLGRFLFHMPDWQPFLEKNDGLVYLSDVRGTCSMHAREEIKAILNKSQRQLFEDYLASHAQSRATPRFRRRRPPPTEQSNLPLSDGA
jgi:hypothetical protein